MQLGIMVRHRIFLLDGGMRIVRTVRVDRLAQRLWLIDRDRQIRRTVGVNQGCFHGGYSCKAITRAAILRLRVEFILF